MSATVTYFIAIVSLSLARVERIGYENEILHNYRVWREAHLNIILFFFKLNNMYFYTVW